jgi:hypothetical protein
MFCGFCGKQIYEGTSFCPFCGRALPNAERVVNPAVTTPEQAVPPAVKSAPRMTTAGTVWCALCLAANLALAIVGIVVLSSQRGSGITEVVAIVAAFVAAFGFMMLLFTNREGFYVVCLAALTGIAINFMEGNVLNAVFCILNPVITWFFIKSTWARMGQPFEKPRSRKTALVLACIPYTGWFGFDRFYLGYGWLGFLKAITCGGFLIWYAIDIVKLARGAMRDGFNMPLSWRSDSPAQAQTARDKAKSLRIWGIVLIAIGLIAGISGFIQIASGSSSETAGSFIMGPLIFGGVGLFLLLKGLKRKVRK